MSCWRNCAPPQKFTIFEAHFCHFIEEEITFNRAFCGDLEITPDPRIFSFDRVHMADSCQVTLMSSSGPKDPS